MKWRNIKFKTWHSKFYLFREGLQWQSVDHFTSWTKSSQLERRQPRKPSAFPPSWEPVSLLGASSPPSPSDGGPRPSQETVIICPFHKMGHILYNIQPCWAWNSLTVFQEYTYKYHHCDHRDLERLTWSDNILDLAFSAFFLWMNSMRTLLFLNTLPLAFR